MGAKFFFSPQKVSAPNFHQKNIAGQNTLYCCGTTSLSCFCFSLLTLLLTNVPPPLFLPLIRFQSNFPGKHQPRNYYIHSICVNYLYKNGGKKKNPLPQKKKKKKKKKK